MTCLFCFKAVLVKCDQIPDFKSFMLLCCLYTWMSKEKHLMSCFHYVLPSRLQLTQFTTFVQRRWLGPCSTFTGCLSLKLGGPRGQLTTSPSQSVDMCENQSLENGLQPADSCLVGTTSRTSVETSFSLAQ